MGEITGSPGPIKRESMPKEIKYDDPILSRPTKIQEDISEDLVIKMASMQTLGMN